MNNLKKKLLSSVLLLAAAASSVPTFAAIPQDVVGTRYEEPIQVLSALKIMIGDDTGAFRPDDSIIRSEVAKIAVHALGLEGAAESMKGQSKFPDVPTDHWANGYINVASANNIVIGDDTGYFRPNDKITYAEAMTMLVRILGYEPQALQKGGYPNGYIQTGTSNGLNKNVTGSAKEYISRGNVAYMTNNALTVKLMEQKNYGSNPTYEVTEKTLLENKLNIKKAEGQITAIPNSSLTGSSNLKEGQIKIGDTVYDTSYNMNNLLGYNVDYYVEKDTDTVILAVPSSGKNSEAVIPADLFERITVKNSKKVIEYFKDENASAVTTAELDQNAVMLYNGKKTDYNESLLNLKNKSGKVTLLDQNKDGKYELIFVTEYRNIFVESVTASGKITDKYKNASIQLDKDVSYRIIKGLEELTVKDLKKNDVLSVAESLDKELYLVEVSNDTINGRVTGSDSDGVFINGERRKIAPSFKETIKVGDTKTFYLDIEGKISGTDTMSAVSGSSYAYLTRAYTSDDDIVKFKLFTTDGKDTIVEANEKIKFNGSGGQTAKSVVSKLNNGTGSTQKQLVTFVLSSDGKLTELNTAEDKTSSGGINENAFTKSFNLTDAVFNSNLSKLGNVGISSDTIIFEIPDGSDKYSVKDISLFENDQKYSAIAYDVQENYTAKVLVVTSSSLMPNASASAAVVKSVATALNSDDVSTYQITVLTDGTEKKLLAENTDTLKKSDGSLLKAGDIIQYKTNSDNEITSIRLLFDISKKTGESKNTPADDFTTVYGKVDKIFQSSINVSVNGASENYTIPDDCKIYSIDTTKTKNNISTASKSDIYVYDESDDNRVFITSYKDTVKEIVIVK